MTENKLKKKENRNKNYGKNKLPTFRSSCTDVFCKNRYS